VKKYIGALATTMDLNCYPGTDYKQLHLYRVLKGKEMSREEVEERMMQRTRRSHLTLVVEGDSVGKNDRNLLRIKRTREE